MRVHDVSPSEEEKQPSSEFAMKVRIECCNCSSLIVLERINGY